jgi:endonuclease/exonuclease/phosphatase family metal-dependent hydrolase
VLRLALTAVALIAGCRDLPDRDPVVRPDADGAPYPPPRGGVVPALGSRDTLEIATWNIENFPAGASTPSAVADLITSLDLDIIIVEEIADDAAWAELLERLREHDGVLSPHRYNATEYQKIGVIYRSAMVTAGAMTLLFTDDTWAFPRPALAVPVTINDAVHPPLTVELVGVHLKAGVSLEDGERRRLAVERLDAHLRAQIDRGGEDEVVIAGDYNEVLNTTTGQTNLAPLLVAPDRYTVRTQGASSAGEISFVPTRRLLDHITTTAGLAIETAGARLVIPPLDVQFAGYLEGVSDHLPVVLITPL